MDDVIKSIKAHLYDRVVSPLSGALIVSWLLWNYKLVFVLFSSESMDYKLSFIDKFYSSIFLVNSLSPEYSFSNALIHGFLGPFTTSIGYIFIYPVFAVPVYRFSLWIQKKYEAARNHHQREKLLTYEQSIELHKRIAELELQQEHAHRDYLTRLEALSDLADQKGALLLDVEARYAELKNQHETLAAPAAASGADSIRSNIELQRKSESNTPQSSHEYKDEILSGEQAGGVTEDKGLKMEKKELKNIYEIFGVDEKVRFIPKDKIYNSYIKKILDTYGVIGSFDVPYVFGSIWDTLDDSKKNEWITNFYKNVSEGHILGVKVYNDQVTPEAYIKIDFSDLKNINSLICLVLAAFRLINRKSLSPSDFVQVVNMPEYYLERILSVAAKRNYVNLNHKDGLCMLTDEGEVFTSINIDPLLESYEIDPLQNLSFS